MSDVWARALPADGLVGTSRVEWAVNHRYSVGRTWQDPVHVPCDSREQAVERASQVSGARVVRRTVTDWVVVP